MTRLEKHSFYSFVSLYVVSSFVLISLVGYWYFTSQKEILSSQIHYKLERIVSSEANKIIYAHMQHTKYHYSPPMGDIKLSIIDTSGSVAYGEPVDEKIRSKHSFSIEDRFAILVSNAPRGHLGIEQIIAKTNLLHTEISDLKQRVIGIMLLVMFVVFVIAWLLSKIFMRPLRQKVSQIESFINDVTHELNTPITSLSMTTKQAIDLGVCTDKMLKNISISTRQLYEIYRSLTYLNFSDHIVTDEIVDIAQVLTDTMSYYQPLAEMKKIELVSNIQQVIYKIPSWQLSLLFGNLIGNAIKYSPARSVITITLKNGIFKIQDEGIGIPKSAQKDIFRKFTRGTKQSGGFGIGLSIVKSICIEYNIAIKINSTLSKGSEFRLDFSQSSLFEGDLHSHKKSI